MEWERADPDRLRDVCRRYGVERLEVFGSVARGEATSDSDIDLLYTLAAGRSLGWEIEDLADELTVILGAPVDLVARSAVNQRFGEGALAEAKPLFPGPGPVI